MGSIAFDINPPTDTTGESTGTKLPSIVTRPVTESEIKQIPTDTLTLGHPDNIERVRSEDVSGEITTYTGETPWDVIFGGTTDVELAIAAGLLFSLSPDDQAKVIQKYIPEAEIVKDEGGTYVVRMFDAQGNPQMGYINKPGASQADFTQFTAQLLSYLPAARLAGMGGTIASKALLGAGASGTTAFTNDQIGQAFTDETGVAINPFNIGVAMAGGALAELVAPAAGHVALAAKNKWKAVFPTDKVPAGPTSIAAADTAEFGIPFTEGQRQTQVGLPGDDVTIDFATGQSRLAAEDVLAKTGGEAGETLVNFEQQQRAAISAAINRTAERLASNVVGAGKAEPVAQTGAQIGADAQRVAAGVRGKKSAFNQLVDRAYGNVDKDAAFEPGSFKKLLSFIDDRLRPTTGDDLRYAKIFHGDNTTLTPPAQKAMGYLERIIRETEEEYARAGAYQSLSRGVPLGQQIAPKFNTLEIVRKKLVATIGTAANATERNETRLIKDAFDDWQHDIIDWAIINGDRNTLEALKNARSLHARYKNTFSVRGPDDGAGRIIDKLARIEDLTNAQVISMLIGGSKVGEGKVTQNVIARLKNIFGTDELTGNFSRDTLHTSPEFSALRQTYFLRLVESAREAADQSISGVGLKKRVANLIFGDGQPVFNQLFTQEEGLTIRKLARSILRTQPATPRSRIHLGSGISLARFSDRQFQKLWGKLGGVGDPLMTALNVGGRLFFRSPQAKAQRVITQPGATPSKEIFSAQNIAAAAIPAAAVTQPESIITGVGTGTELYGQLFPGE